eukprot:2168656-Rhodomonas_salina.2
MPSFRAHAIVTASEVSFAIPRNQGLESAFLVQLLRSFAVVLFFFSQSAGSVRTVQTPPCTSASANPYCENRTQDSTTLLLSFQSLRFFLCLCGLSPGSLQPDPSLHRRCEDRVSGRDKAPRGFEHHSAPVRALRPDADQRL